MEGSCDNGACLLTPFDDKQDQEPVQGSSIILPPEILDMVCGSLPKYDLKQVRQVSKDMGTSCGPLPLRSDLYVFQHGRSLHRKACCPPIQAIHPNFGVSFVYYLAMDRESFDEVFDEELGVEVDTDISHSDHAIELYCITRKNQKENLESGLSSAYLSFALPSCPSIRKIVLTDSSSSRSMSRESLQVFEPRRSKDCPIEACVLEDTEHFPLRVRQSGFACQGSPNPWRLILQSLSVTNSSVGKLTIVPEDYETSVGTSAFSMSPGELSQAKLYFHALTKIRLALAWNLDQNRHT